MTHKATHLTCQPSQKYHSDRYLVPFRQVNWLDKQELEVQDSDSNEVGSDLETDSFHGSDHRLSRPGTSDSDGAGVMQESLEIPIVRPSKRKGKPKIIFDI